MGLTCIECGTVNADGGAFCTGCGVSLAFATPTGAVKAQAATPVGAVRRNPFPEEPGRASGNAGGWVGVLLIALVGGLAVAGTGWWAFNRASAPKPRAAGATDGIQTGHHVGARW